MQAFVVILLAIASAEFATSSPTSLNQPRILNGEEAELGQFPWNVAIVSINPLLNMTNFCGGAIISEEWVLTSAYCIYNSSYSVVYSGTVDFTAPGTLLSLAETHLIPTGFNPDPIGIHRFQYDIGLIKLDTPLVFDDNTKAIALAEDEIDGGVLVTITGFGHISNDYGNDQDNGTNTLLHYAAVPTMTNEDCSHYTDDADPPGLFCTYFHNGDEDFRTNACVGDGGSPVVLNADTNPVHVGIFSFIAAFGCDSGWPSGHTRTAYYRNWIKEHTGV